MRIIKWLSESYRLSIAKRYKRELFDNVFMIKDPNILTIKNVIPPSHKKYTKGAYLQQL